MKDEEQNQPEEQRKLKIRGGALPAKGDQTKEVREKETGSKMWVLVILVITVIASLVFSLKNRIANRSNSPVENVEMENPGSGGGLFAPAVYEFEK